MKEDIFFSIENYDNFEKEEVRKDVKKFELWLIIEIPLLAKGGLYFFYNGFEYFWVVISYICQYFSI